MAPGMSQSGPDLKVNLDRAKDTGYCEFTGGDIIYGHVLRESPLVDTDASIYVRLRGQSEFHYAVSAGMAPKHVSSHFSLLDDSTKSLQIHRGPLHIPPDSSQPGRWPFAIQLPTHPDLAALQRSSSEMTFAPLKDISSQEIPPSFQMKSDSYGPGPRGWVEYYLEVTMRCSGTETTLIGAKINKEFKAIKMVYVRADVSPIPITDFDIKSYSEKEQRVASQRLLPGSGLRLSLGQHLKKMLGSSQVPVYAFSLHVEVASVLQVGNSNCIPFRLRAETSWNDTSEILQSMPPMILVKNFVLNLKTMSFGSSKHFRSRNTQANGMLTEFTLPLVTFNWTPGSMIASEDRAADPKAEFDAPPSADKLIVPQDGTAHLDLGIALGIRTPKKPDRKIYPTFTTCNLRNIHYLEWWITLIIGGETVRYRRQQYVTVVGPT